MKTRSESGVALIGALLILVLLSGLLVGFVISVTSDQRLIGVDRDQNRAFYGSLAGLEQLTADLGTLFNTNYAPSVAQINALTANVPNIPYISYIAPGGGSGYEIQFALDAAGKPQAVTRTIPSGPYEGLVGLITSYTMTSTAHTPTDAEVRMRRTLQTVAVPVFQFGIFSETDLSYHAGPDFNFGGRVHTNGNLYLAEGTGSVLTMSNRVTAVGEVIRTNLINGWPSATNYQGRVDVATAPGAFRALAAGEGSLVGTFPSAQNEPTWTNLSIGTYNGNIRNGRTGARRMDLPLVGMGATPVDLIRRPPANEDVANPDVFAQRYFTMASLRILLSDNAADLTSLPTVTATAPLALAGIAPDGTPIATSAGNVNPSVAYTQGYRSPIGTNLIDGFIKIEMQTAAGNWQDVTQEILQLGVAGRDLTLTCVDPPNSIIRVQRLKDTPAACVGGASTQYWPNVLFDTREGALRDNIPTAQTTVYLGGVMHYLELDVNNLSRWFRGVIGASGNNAINVTGYVVYFSDRRTNRNAANLETGEYGFEDFVNPGSVSGTPNGLLDAAEDVNNNGVLDTYGQNPILPGTAPLDATARPWTPVAGNVARVNHPIFFRRALKLVNGQTIDLGTSNGIPLGLAVASENPIYVQGNYNAPGTFAGAHVACSMIADTVTLLSNSWNDINSFAFPYSPGARNASTSWYRTALISGKAKPFPQPAGTPQDYGTDGGVHNFVRLLENWSGRWLNYRGSLISLYFSQQAVGTYKCCTNVYNPPSRGYNFDVEFLDPSLLPPRTPMFRDVNITGFTRLIAPNK
ncbi:MAG: hypothetical protein LAP85_18025 [Acidobacteriia bacterium]|nr:hypothetical protein [Terriglobia bacterium]